MASTPHLTFASGSRPIGAWACETVQRHADDVVLAAARCKPNAPGGFELSPSGFGTRQLLKARGAYLGERVLLGLTPLHLYAVELLVGGRIRRVVARSARADLAVEIVAANRSRRETGDQRRPALLISRRDGWPFAEVQVVEPDADSERLVALLLSGSSIVGHRPEPAH
jgi:hypothetical protein